jgi:hypothetical protein
LFGQADKVGRRMVQTEEDAKVLQDCLDKLIKWGEEWSMEFNVKKCKIMHFGRNNKKFKYTMNGVELAVVESERDIGVCVNSNLKPSKHCREATNKARAVLGQISRCFHFRDRTVFLRLYTQYVRPHLEFASSVWSPWNVADISMLEDVQKKAIGMISGLRSRDYAAKLQELDLWSLQKRRVMCDLIQVYKVANKIGNVKCGLQFNQDRVANNIPTRHQADPLNLVERDQI